MFGNFVGFMGEGGLEPDVGMGMGGRVNHPRRGG